MLPNSTDLLELAEALDARAATAGSVDAHAQASACARGAGLARDLAGVVSSTLDRSAPAAVEPVEVLG